MYFSCKCLNFIIESRFGADPVDSTMKNQLSSRALSHELVLVTLESIIKRIDILVGMIQHNEWTEFHCRNCSMWMYTCCRRENDPSISNIIVNKSSMITHAEIEKLKEDTKYSPVFQILLFHEKDDNLLSGSVEPLHPAASAWLQKQTQLTENRIKNFADEQYAELEKKRMRARMDHLAVKRAAFLDKMKKIQIQEPVQHGFVSLSRPVKSAPMIPMTCEQSLRPDNILEMDESLMFEARSDCSHHSEGSDDDIEVAHPQRATEPLAMARSLPIPVPQFLEERHHDDRHDRSPQTPKDIAANIKALARSIHGEPVFGELPRPRFTKD